MTLAHRRMEPAALLRRLTPIPGRDDRRVLRVPARPELGAALLDPIVEIRLRDPVRVCSARGVGREDLDRRVFLGHFFGGARAARRDTARRSSGPSPACCRGRSGCRRHGRSRSAGDCRFEILPHRIGARAGDDGVEP